MKKGVKNILKVINQATEIEIDEGRAYYTNLRQVAVNLGEYYGYPLPLTIAVFAALSPNTDYFNNLRSAATVLDAHKRGYDPSRVKVSSYGHCKDRAFTYLNGVDFMETVGGLKIRAFYQNISNPMDAYPVCVDGHAFNIWRDVRIGLKMSSLPPKIYREIAEDYRDVSNRLSLLPNQVQSITWLTWKWINNIKTTKRQLSLLVDRRRDIYRTIYAPEDILPYKLMC